jgi:hypothetical protein
LIRLNNITKFLNIIYKRQRKKFYKIKMIFKDFISLL